MMQPTGNVAGATDNVPVVLEIDSEGGEPEAKQPTGNLAGATNSSPVVTEVDNDESSDQNGGEPEVHQMTGKMAGAANDIPVVVEIENEASNETNGLVKPRETVDSKQDSTIQMNGELDNELRVPELSGDTKEESEEGEREEAVSREEEKREREENDQEAVVGVKEGVGGVEGQEGCSCHDDEGGGEVSEKTDVEQSNQCVNGDK